MLSLIPWDGDRDGLDYGAMRPSGVRSCHGQNDMD